MAPGRSADPISRSRTSSSERAHSQRPPKTRSTIDVATCAEWSVAMRIWGPTPTRGLAASRATHTGSALRSRTWSPCSERCGTWRTAVSQLVQETMAVEKVPLNLAEKEKIQCDLLDEIFGLGPLDPSPPPRRPVVG